MYLNDISKQGTASKLHNNLNFSKETFSKNVVSEFKKKDNLDNLL